MKKESRRNSYLKALAALADLEPALIVPDINKQFHTTRGSEVDSLSAYVSLSALKSLTPVMARLPWTRRHLPVLMLYALEGINPINAKLTAVVGDFLESAAHCLPWGEWAGEGKEKQAGLARRWAETQVQRMISCSSNLELDYARDLAGGQEDELLRSASRIFPVFAEGLLDRVFYFCKTVFATDDEHQPAPGERIFDTAA